MKRRPVEWLPAPDDDDDLDSDHKTMQFRVIDHWLAVDQDQLLLPIRVLDKTDVKVSEDGYTAVLKQYGGESLLNDMLMSEADLERGSTWELRRWQNRLEIEPIEDPDDS